VRAAGCPTASCYNVPTRFRPAQGNPFASLPRGGRWLSSESSKTALAYLYPCLCALPVGAAPEGPYQEERYRAPAPEIASLLVPTGGSGEGGGGRERFCAVAPVTNARLLSNRVLYCVVVVITTAGPQLVVGQRRNARRCPRGSRRLRNARVGTDMAERYGPHQVTLAAVKWSRRLQFRPQFVSSRGSFSSRL